MRRRRHGAVGGPVRLALPAAVLVVGSGLAVIYVLVPASGSTSDWMEGLSNIKHVVILLEENHADDNLFGTYCTTAQPVCPTLANGIPAGVCIPFKLTSPTGPCLSQYPFNAAKLSSPHDLGHSYTNSHAAFNNGSMNGFLQSESTNLTMGHYNGTTLTVYWDFAQSLVSRTTSTLRPFPGRSPTTGTSSPAKHQNKPRITRSRRVGEAGAKPANTWPRRTPHRARKTCSPTTRS